jgi:hypothetical protein
MATISWNGYRILSVDGKRIAEHRQIWIDNFGEIPKGKIIHHKNGDKLDNRIENLELTSRNVHRYMHHGNHWSEEHNLRVSKKLKGKLPKNFNLIKNSWKITGFKKGNPPPKHRDGCKCFRCKGKSL